jgi:hypothetical protein
MDPYEADAPPDVIQSAIDGALDQHAGMRKTLAGAIDPVSIAISCADAAGRFWPEQAALAARLLLAAEAIRRQRQQILGGC